MIFRPRRRRPPLLLRLEWWLQDRFGELRWWWDGRKPTVGVTIHEVAFEPRTRIVLLGDAPFPKGPVNEVVRIESREQFESLFGWTDGPSGPRPVRDDGTIEHEDDDGGGQAR